VPTLFFTSPENTGTTPLSFPLRINSIREIYLSQEILLFFRIEMIPMKRHHVMFTAGGILLLLVLTVPPSNASPLTPDQPGPYPIGFYRTGYLVIPYGIYTATIRYPATTNGSRSPLNTSASPYPGIIVGNGFAGSEQQINWIAEHLTSYGYVTLTFTPPRRVSFNPTQWAYGFLNGITTLQRQNKRPWSPINHALDGETWGAIGLSMGGGGCVEATGLPGSPIDASVALAPAGLPDVLTAAHNILVPIQLQVGTVDRIVPPEHVLEIYTMHLTNDTTKEFLSITGGNHLGYIDEEYASQAQQWGIDNPPGISVEQQHNISRTYFTAWFQYHLRHLDDYYPYIFGEEAHQDLESGVLSDLRYNIP
jgi:dienelactone hydrolase